MNYKINTTEEGICRTCLNKEFVLDISHDIYKKLKICGGIDIKDISIKDFSNKICQKCCINLEISYEFRNICQQSDKKLRQSLNHFETEKNDDVDFLKVEILTPKDEPEENIKQFIANNSDVKLDYNLGNIHEKFILNDQPTNFVPVHIKCTSQNFVKDISENELESLSDGITINIKDKRKYKIKRGQNVNKNKIAAETLYTCEFCGVGYVSKFSMENHLRLHSARLRFVCEICGESYAGKFQLEQHMCSKHTGERNFKCDHCDKAFFSKTLRNKHQKRSHSKLFKCCQCEKSFGRSDSLKKHMRVHTGEKPIVCDKCGTRFKELHHLKNHNKSMTPCILKMSIKVKDQ